jgi:hypothetical protein
MGLAERRGVENFKTGSYPAWKERIDEKAGFEVDVEVEWDSLGEPGHAEEYERQFPKIYFEPLVGALEAITIDDLGRKALKEGLKKVVVKNSDTYYSPTGFAFSGGVLTIDHQPHYNVDYWEERRDALRRLLEDGL